MRFTSAHFMQLFFLACASVLTFQGSNSASFAVAVFAGGSAVLLGIWRAADLIISEIKKIKN